MDDLILNNKSNLINLKGKNWSSLQNLESEDSEESSELNYHQNGFLNCNNLVNGEFNDKYTSTNSSDDSSLPLIKHCDTSKLNREDMCIYGLRPAYDQFYLVVCEYCKKVVKPQALSKHIEIRHSNNNLINNNNNNNNLLNDNNEFLKHVETIDNEFNRQQSNLRTNSLLATSLTRDDLELEKLKQQKLNLQTNSKLKSNLFKSLDSKSNSSSNSIASSPLTDNNNQITITSTNLKPKLTKTKLLPCKDRKYDPDKHCGVKLNEQDTPCTRSLTCKTHSLTLRRAAGIEVKPTKLQLKQQQRLQKNNQLKEQQQLKQNNNCNSKLNNQLLNNKTTFNGNQTTQPIQLKIHLQSPNTSNLNTSPFKSFNKLHQNESNNSNDSTINSSQLNTALQSPTNSFVNINNLPFTSSQQSPTIKQFTFTNNNNQLGKLLSSPNRTNLKPTINNFNSNNNQSTSLLTTSSIQVINQTNLNNNHLDNKNNSQYYDQSNKNYSTNSLIQHSSQQQKPFNCDINPSSTLNHYPKPAAVCTFNERRLSILTPSNKKVLSSKLFNRKQDYSFSAITILCNKEKIINNNQLNEQLTSPIKQNSNKLSKSIKQQNLQNLNSNSQASITSNYSISSSNGNRTTNDYLSSGNSNSQEIFQTTFINQNSNLFNQTNQF